MSVGYMMFYGGVAGIGITLILGVVWMIAMKKKRKRLLKEIQEEY